MLNRCDIEWIGAKDDGGQGFHTGKDALKHTLSVLRANPSLASRPTLLLYDNDTTVQDQNYGRCYVRTLPKNTGNDKITAGIENLLRADCLEERFYDTKEKKKPNGDTTITRSLRKSDLCEHMRLYGLSEQFAAFDPALDIIERYLDEVTSMPAATRDDIPLGGCG